MSSGGREVAAEFKILVLSTLEKHQHFLGRGPWSATYDPRELRPSSDVVLLPCRTKLQFSTTVARQDIFSDSDVVPESNQIQGLLKPRNNSN